MTVSLSRFTLLPLVFVGVLTSRVTDPPENDGEVPELRESFSADSKSVWPARKLGVLMLAMLSAVTRERSDRPLSAACSAAVVVSPTAIMARPGVEECRRTRSPAGYAGRALGGSSARSADPWRRLLSVQDAHRHPGG